MENKLTFEDFFASVGIIAVSAVLYSMYNKKKPEFAEAKDMILQPLSEVMQEVEKVVVVENIKMNPNLYAPTNALDGYMELYDYSEINTIGAVRETIKNAQ